MNECESVNGLMNVMNILYISTYILYYNNLLKIIKKPYITNIVFPKILSAHPLRTSFNPFS